MYFKLQFTINYVLIKNYSHINVSLIYLRSLEIAELKEEDMPMI